MHKDVPELKDNMSMDYSLDKEDLDTARDLPKQAMHLV